MSDAIGSITMPTAFTSQDRFFLTACRAGAQAAICSRTPLARVRTQDACVPRARRQAVPLLTHSYERSAYAYERASRMQRQRAKPVSLLTMTKRRLLDEPFRLWRRRHS